jgi:hypothetical protein
MNRPEFPSNGLAVHRGSHFISSRFMDYQAPELVLNSHGISGLVATYFRCLTSINCNSSTIHVASAHVHGSNRPSALVLRFVSHRFDSSH